MEGKDASGEVEISIIDTGIGIAPEKIDLLFQQFSQADSSTTRRYGGTGLGLAISKKLVELMGGSIHVESSEGVGSTFGFSLRLPLSAASAVSPVPASSLYGLRVLIVDDIEVNRRVVHEQISSWGMRNGSYASAEEALHAIREARASGDPYNLVIADYQMPEIDGATLAAAIKADSALDGIVFILLTSIGNWRELRSLEGTSVDACLVKPVRRAKLMETLATAWAKSIHRKLKHLESNGRESRRRSPQRRRQVRTREVQWTHSACTWGIRFSSESDTLPRLSRTVIGVTASTAAAIAAAARPEGGRPVEHQDREHAFDDLRQDQGPDVKAEHPQ